MIQVLSLNEKSSAKRTGLPDGVAITVNGMKTMLSSEPPVPVPKLLIRFPLLYNCPGIRRDFKAIFPGLGSERYSVFF